VLLGLKPANRSGTEYKTDSSIHPFVLSLLVLFIIVMRYFPNGTVGPTIVLLIWNV
jgi:hypothetical protein